MRGLFLLLLVSSGVWAQSPRIVDRIDEIVVTGEQPGPKLWKLTKNGHTLWILATVNPKPRDIIWKSVEVADVLNDTQEVFNQTVIVDFDVKSLNPLAGMKAYRAAQKLNAAAPKAIPLRDAVPAEAYERFTKLKALYLPASDGIEHDSPRMAADRLFNAAIGKKGLTMQAQIHEAVHKLARKRRISVSDVKAEYKFDVETLIQVQLEFMQIPKDLELACFEETLSLLEKNLPDFIERANAWAKGDVEKLRSLKSERRLACNKAYWHAPRWTDMDSDLDRQWLKDIEAAVEKNKSTLAMLDIVELTEPDGVIHMLAKRGFEIEGPP